MLPPAALRDGRAGRADALPAPPRDEGFSSALSGWLRLAPSAAVELANKAEIFGRFRAASAAAGSGGPLGERVRQARNLGAFPALWTVEGLGHGFAAAACRSGRRPGGLLADLAARAVPAGAWLPLHTGMGLALAERALDGEGNLGRRLHRFEELCLAGSRPGYAKTAFEGLGFVARTLHSRSIPAVDRALATRSAELASYFWHGIGRGLYFSPLHAFPGGTVAALARAGAEAPAAAARANAVAGVAWAFTLVNLRHREVLASLAELASAGLGRPAREAFAQGVGAALAIWAEWAGLPGPAFDAPWALGNPRVRRVFDDALARCRAGRVQEVFRCR